MNSLYIAWRSGESAVGRWGPVGKLERVNHFFRFTYTKGARMLPGFTAFAGMNDLYEVYESETLFPLFANRLLAERRTEYQAFLEWGGFKRQSQPDPLAILGITEGRRFTDALEVFPCPAPDANGDYACTFFLHGVRHASANAQHEIAEMQSGATLILRPETGNPHDAMAMAVFQADIQDGERLGYLPRFLARDARTLMSEKSAKIDFTVKRINLDAPLQQRVLCVLNCPWPAGFNPCQSEEYQPLLGTESALAA